MQFVFDAEGDWEFAVSLSILIVVVFVSYKLVNDEQLVYVVVKVGRWVFLFIILVCVVESEGDSTRLLIY